VDGAKPFRYRGRVRSLLGIPDGEGGGLTFSPTLLPVGFKYTSDAFTGRFYPMTQRPASAVALGDKVRDEPAPQDRAGKSSLTQDMAQSGQEQAAVKPAEMPERAGAKIEKANLEIPGMSEKSQLFPALSSAKEDPTLVDRIENQPRPAGPKTEIRGAFRVSEFEGVARQRDTATELKQGLAAKATEPGAGIEQSSTEIPGGSEKSQSFPALSPEKKDDAPVGRISSRPRQAVFPADAREGVARAPRSEQSQPVQGRRVTNAAPDLMHVSERLQEAGQVRARLVTAPELRPGPAMAELKVAGSVRPNVVNRSNAEAADTIEQLRHAVQRLSSKVASQPPSTERETTQQSLPAPPRLPVQPVVIVRRPVAPRAFWERSYLGRLHLRILR